MEEEINEIGNLMVSCELPCEGIQRDPHLGRIPRGMILEMGNVNMPGCIVVGLNPGNGSDAEFEHYLHNGNTYEAVVNFWHHPPVNQGINHPYYQRLRAFVNSINVQGAVLWTELVKCQGHNLQTNTIRTCVNNLLFNELEAFVPGSIIIAACRKAFEIVPYVFPGSTVIGIPHPTGGGGNHFLRLFNDHNVNNGLRAEVLAQIPGIGQASWLRAQ